MRRYLLKPDESLRTSLKTAESSWIPGQSDKESIILIYKLETIKKDFSKFQQRLKALEKEPFYDTWLYAQIGDYCRDLLGYLKSAEFYDYGFAKQFQETLHQYIQLQAQVYAITLQFLKDNPNFYSNTGELLTRMEFVNTRGAIRAIDLFPTTAEQLRNCLDRLGCEHDNWANLFQRYTLGSQHYSALTTFIGDAHKELKKEFEHTKARAHVNFVRYIMLNPSHSKLLKPGEKLYELVKESLSFARSVYDKPSRFQYISARLSQVDKLIESLKTRPSEEEKSREFSTQTMFKQMKICPQTTLTHLKTYSQWAEMEQFKCNYHSLEEKPNGSVTSILVLMLNLSWFNVSNNNTLTLKDTDKLTHIFRNLDLSTVRVVAAAHRSLAGENKLLKSTMSVSSYIRTIESTLGMNIFKGVYYLDENGSNWALHRERFLHFFDSGSSSRSILLLDHNAGNCNAARQERYQAIQVQNNYCEQVIEHYHLPEYKPNVNTNLGLTIFPPPIQSPTSIQSPSSHASPLSPPPIKSPNSP